MSSKPREKTSQGQGRRLPPLRPPVDEKVIFPYEWLTRQWEFNKREIEALERAGLTIYQVGRQRFFEGKTLASAIRSGVIVEGDTGGDQ